MHQCLPSSAGSAAQLGVEHAHTSSLQEGDQGRFVLWQSAAKQLNPGLATATLPCLRRMRWEKKPCEQVPQVQPSSLLGTGSVALSLVWPLAC